ncbi:TIR domain-containing protein, partial [Frankia sp. CiP3]|uniref:TIR domain-containing protein n=1 Tax=Frankia sp. CiP3 TaxID=2880971 RepID=UPI001EF748A9
MVGDGRTVFLSYAEADEPWAVWVAWQLREAGYQPRLQAWHSVPGGNFVGWIRAELMAASCVMVILSPAYLDSKWCEAELNVALADAVAGRKLLLPVRVAPCEAPPLLREIGRISLVDRSEADACRALVGGLMAAASGEAALSTAAPVYPGTGDRGQPPRFPGPDNGELRLRLLGLVQEACRERHPEAAVHGSHREGPFPYVDVSGERDGERRRWPVGISVNAPDAGAVEAFYNTVVQETYLPLEPWPDSELVYLGEPPGEEVLRQARRRRVRLFSLAEFEGRWDPRRYLARQQERLADDAVYPPGLYVPQRFIVAQDAVGRAVGHDGELAVQRDVFAAMCDWLDVEEARFLLILGDFGHGKSFLLRELTRRLPDEVAQVAPLLVELRALEKTHSVDELLALHLTKLGEHGVDVRAVRRMVEQGKVALLFDGFDELALRVTYDRAAEHLRTILAAVTGRAKVVLTSRSQHFLTDDQHRTELGDQVRLAAASREVHLVNFDEEQMREFLVRLFHRQVAAEAVAGKFTHGDDAVSVEAARRAEVRFGLIRSIHDLLGLSANPRMLSFIADLDEQELLAVRAADGTITSADLYAKLLARWLDHEVARRQPTRGAYQTLTVNQLRQAVDALAVALWDNEQDSTDLDGLSQTVRTTLTDLGPAKLDAGQATFMVGSGSLLVRTDDARFSFVHRSVMEYLVAAQAAAQLTDADEPPRPGLLAGREMSDLMVDFLYGIAQRAKLEQWARSALAEHSNATAAARGNALRLARTMKLTIEGVRLAGQDLRGQDLTGRNLRFANLRRANLSGLQLYDTDLTGADLTDADLTGTLLVRPTLTGATLTGSTWTGA